MLNRHRVEYLVVGAWAVAFHGRPRYTGAVDVFLRRDPTNAARMMQVIEAFGFGATDLTQEDFLKENFVIQLGVEPDRIDLLTGISGVELGEAWDQRVAGSLGGLEMQFISRALLIRNKRTAQRDKDLGDIRLLKQTPLERPDD